MNNSDNQVIITVSGKDKVGIVAGVSNRLLQYNVNIEDIKQTIMQDNFVEVYFAYCINKCSYINCALEFILLLPTPVYLFS